MPIHKFLYIFFPAVFFLQCHSYASPSGEYGELRDRLEALENRVNYLEKNSSGQNKLEEPAKAREDGKETSSMDVFEAADRSSSEPESPEEDAKPKKEKDFYDLALSNLKDKNFDGAEKVFSDFIKDFPKSKLIGNAYFWLGESHYARENFNEAATSYLKSYKATPKGDKAGDSLVKLSLALSKLNKNKEACGIINKAEEEFRKGSASLTKKISDAKLKLRCK